MFIAKKLSKETPFFDNFFMLYNILFSYTAVDVGVIFCGAGPAHMKHKRRAGG